MRRALAHQAWVSCHDTAEPICRNRRNLPVERHDQPNPARGLAPLSRLAARAFAADEGGCLLRRLPDCLDRHAVAVCRASRDIGTLGPQPAKGDDGLVRCGAFAGADGFGLNHAFRPCEYSSAQESG